MDAFAAYSEYMMEHDREAARRNRPTTWSASWSTPRSKGQRLEDHQIVTEVLLLLIGGDETTRHTLSGGTEAAAAAPRSAPASGQRPEAAAQRDRGDAALDLAGEEHGPHDHRRHRVPRHAAAPGREDDPAVRVGELRRDGVRGSGELRHRRATRTTTWRSASGRTSASATSWPGWRCRSCSHACCSGCRTCGWRRMRDLPLRPANFVCGLEKMPVVFTPTAPLG